MISKRVMGTGGMASLYNFKRHKKLTKVLGFFVGEREEGKTKCW